MFLRALGKQHSFQSELKIQTSGNSSSSSDASSSSTTEEDKLLFSSSSTSFFASSTFGQNQDSRGTSIPYKKGHQ